MIQIDNVSTWGFEHSIRGMRNPMNSWSKSDSKWEYDYDTAGPDTVYVNCHYVIGPDDLKLMHKLFIAGTEHRKFMRMIHVTMDINAPLYWWKEYDTYKVGTVANSCSTMHKIADHVFTLDDFSHEHLTQSNNDLLLGVCTILNYYRDRFLEHHEKDDWWQMIQLLPSSYNQKRTVDMNYETAATIIRQRTGHKLDEWHTLVDQLWELPYMHEIIEGM